jgi:isopropylmalate/homocitrate/citramalate synthase
MQACALRDLETAWEAVRLAKRPRVHTFLATSEIHMKHKLKMTPDQARLACHRPPCARMHNHSPAPRFSVMHIPTMQLLGCNRHSFKVCTLVTIST